MLYKFEYDFKKALVPFSKCLFHLTVPENNSKVNAKNSLSIHLKFGHNSRLFNLQNSGCLRIMLMDNGTPYWKDYGSKAASK